ncbi:hypothetical protein DL98DRAFT_429466 [Cadophora sp. DSE1049]|nr:hypothetical protein DL98DRAFT_429466 [Cadophora sp. DSE1049]
MRAVSQVEWKLVQSQNCCINIDFGKNRDAERCNLTFWRKAMKDSYRCDERRRTLRMAVINMRDRDGLHGRLEYVRCPVLWLHVSRNPNLGRKKIKLFKISPDARLRIIEGGQHVLSYLHRQEVEQNAVEFLGKDQNN